MQPCFGQCMAISWAVAISPLLSLPWWLTLLAVLGVEVLAEASTRGVGTRGVARLRRHGKDRGVTRKHNHRYQLLRYTYCLLMPTNPSSWTRTLLCKPSGCSQKGRPWPLCLWQVWAVLGRGWGYSARAWSNGRGSVLFTSSVEKGKASQQLLW